MFLFAALDHATGAVIGQESIGEKTNEIPHFQPLLDQIPDLSEVVVTADALHTQLVHAEYLHGRGAHYVLTVKINQRALRDRIASQTWSTRTIQHSRSQKSHGRTTTWAITAQVAQAWNNSPPSFTADFEKALPLLATSQSTTTAKSLDSSCPAE